MALINVGPGKLPAMPSKPLNIKPAGAPASPSVPKPAIMHPAYHKGSDEPSMKNWTPVKNGFNYPKAK